jgi:hypothetical protein
MEEWYNIIDRTPAPYLEVVVELETGDCTLAYIYPSKEWSYKYEVIRWRYK